MKLYFQQRLFSWFDSYDIYDENNKVYFEVEGKLSWGHLFQIYHNNIHVGTLKEQLFRFLPHYTMFENEMEIGEIIKKFTFLKPKFNLTCNDWEVNGNWIEWNYEIISPTKGLIATIEKDLFHLTDYYIINIVDEKDALKVLMIVLAIDAVKCNYNN